MASGASQKTKTHAVTTQTPNVPGWISSPYQTFAGQVSTLGQTDPMSFVTPATANQNRAFSFTGTGNPTGEGYAATQPLTGYTPGSVTADSLSETDLAPYMNPYQQNVIDAMIGDFGNANAVGLNQLRASTPSGAFNGSRQGVAEGQLTGDNLRTLASTVSGLRSANFSQAQQAASSDIANRLSADQFNVNSGLQGAQFRLNAADQLANIGMLGANNSRADTQLLADMGAQERSINSENNPNVARINLLQLLGSLYGQIPAQLFTGQTSVQDATSKTSSNPGLLGGLGSLLTGLGGIGFNPFQVKPG